VATKTRSRDRGKDILKANTKAILLKWLKRLTLFGLLLFVLGVGLIIYANATAVWASQGKLFEDVKDLPSAKVGLVFGTTDRLKGRENRYFRYRIDAAVKVWKAGKVETFIVSGDNRSKYYNEPQKMKNALIEEGVPASRIVCDYAGLRTLDSVVRAKKIFGADKILVISQRFQNERAIYLAQANGIEAFGFNAQDVELQAGYKTKIREVGARVKMWLDVNFLDTAPTHLGDKVELPGDP
jgi:SanA protein